MPSICHTILLEYFETSECMVDYMRQVFSTTIVAVGLIMFVVGVGSFFIIVPDESTSRFLLLLGGLATLIGIRMYSPSISQPSLIKALPIISFFVFIGSTLIALITIFRDTGVSMLIAVFSLGCAILTALIYPMMEHLSKPSR